MTEIHQMREIENLLEQVKSLEQSNERLKQSVVDLINERIEDAILMDRASDEIERLRADQREADEEFSLLQNDLGQALIEIENLRLALEVAANDLDDWGAYTKANNARAALEGE